MPGTGPQGQQTRQMLGLPDRSSYFPGAVGLSDLEQLGAFPNVRTQPQAKKTRKALGEPPLDKQTKAKLSSPEQAK